MKILTLFFLMFSAVTFSTNGAVLTPQKFENNLISMQNSTKIDEFEDYWYNDFRQTPTCDIAYSKYKEMMTKYNELGEDEKTIVNNWGADSKEATDGYKVIDVINTLKRKFNSDSGSGDSDKKKLDQTTMIWIVSGVAIFGISTILVFYILKNKKVIE